MTNLMMVVGAVRRAQHELATYLNGDEPDPGVITARLVVILNNLEVISALEAVSPREFSPPTAPHDEAVLEDTESDDVELEVARSLKALSRKTGKLRGVDILLAPFHPPLAIKKPRWRFIG